MLKMGDADSDQACCFGGIQEYLANGWCGWLARALPVNCWPFRVGRVSS